MLMIVGAAAACSLIAVAGFLAWVFAIRCRMISRQVVRDGVRALGLLEGERKSMLAAKRRYDEDAGLGQLEALGADRKCGACAARTGPLAVSFSGGTGTYFCTDVARCRRNRGMS